MLRLPRFSILLAVAFGLVGCQPEEKITTATRPRLNDMKRMLAALVPDKNPDEKKAWVFKVAGRESEIEPIAQAFDDFVKSVRFADPDKPTWTLPPGWSIEKDKASDTRFATIYTGPKDKSPELAVSYVQGELATSLPKNIDRWRMQLGLRGLGLRLVDVEDFLRPITVDGQSAFVIDMTGPGGRAEMQAPQLPPDPELPFKYQVPPGWKVIPPTSSLYALSIQSEGTKAIINVMVSRGAGGGLAANVNRWRDQVKLGEAAGAEMRALPDVDIGNAKGKLVDITGPDAPKEKNRILGAILIRANDALFFKMMGPSDTVGRERPAFESFLKSMHFGS